VSNISYCRFRNTLLELRECEEAFGEMQSLKQIEDEEERNAALLLIRVCKRIANECGDLLP